jgi:hypothetical protein
VVQQKRGDNMNKNIKNLIGMKFGRLTVLGLSDKKSRKTYWDCICDCGNFKTARSDSLQDGSIKSCGCLKKEQDKLNLNQTTHNLSKTRIYKTWQGMKKRIFNPNDTRFANYGGRGIKICDEWLDFEKFYMWSISNGYSKNLTIDRIDNNGNYEPNNCRWVDMKTQSRNRSSNILITIGNTTKCLIEWCELFNLKYTMVHARYKNNENITLDELFKQ